MVDWTDEMDNAEWLRKSSSDEWCGGALNKCADEIEQLREENARLRAALKPFAEVAKRDIGESETDDDRFRPLIYNRAPHITVGHLRAAAAAIREGGKDG